MIRAFAIGENQVLEMSYPDPEPIWVGDEQAKIAAGRVVPVTWLLDGQQITSDEALTVLADSAGQAGYTELAEWARRVRADGYRQ